MPLVVSKSVTQVSRRHGYKGSVEGMRTGFPVDVCTLPGLCATLAIMLSGKGLTKPLLETSFNALSSLNSLAKPNGVFKLLPDNDGAWIEVTDGLVSKDELKKLVSCLDMDYTRWDKDVQWNVSLRKGKISLLHVFIFTFTFTHYIASFI